ncbi:MAG TPA: carboxylesterase family protein, partial [Steroidobacteraceae bacterium]|nr:carboxylesterase family protein [Steroidobacteraceae bacterium]
MTEDSNRYSRRSVLVAGASVAATGLLGHRAFAADAPIAKTAYGRVRGVTQDGVNIFKGVPYGASTAGKNRFMPPVAPTPWTDVRDTLAYGPSTPQSDPSAKRSPAASADFIGELSDRPESEDCLVLNVWSRGLADNGKRPVMFWIHGGGFTTGSGSSPGYDGVNLSKRGDVVVVTINHRLNFMGHSFFSDLSSEFAGIANVGMLDIVHALKWVKNNIEQFGGDPNRVMIFGESGGGRKIGVLLAMPEAKGLFHRAVMESGASIRVVSREDATAAAQAVLAELQIAKNEARKAQDVPLDKLLTATFAAARKHRLNHTTTGYAPCVDGKVLPEHPFHPQASAIMPD